MKTNKKTEEEFHAVEFMRAVRENLTEQFFRDKKKYLEFLNISMQNFKLKQKKVYK